MGIQAITLTAEHIADRTWAVRIEVKHEDGMVEEHPHSPFHMHVSPSYNRPESITGLVLQEASCKLLHR